MKCPICLGTMEKIEDAMKQDGVTFYAHRCGKCGEELMDMNQLKELAKEMKIKEGDHALLKRSKEGLEIVAA